MRSGRRGKAAEGDSVARMERSEIRERPTTSQDPDFAHVQFGLGLLRNIKEGWPNFGNESAGRHHVVGDCKRSWWIINWRYNQHCRRLYRAKAKFQRSKKAARRGSV